MHLLSIEVTLFVIFVTCAVHLTLGQRNADVRVQGPLTSCDLQTSSKIVYYVRFNYTGPTGPRYAGPDCYAIYSCKEGNRTSMTCDPHVYYLVFMESREVWVRFNGNPTQYYFYKELIMDAGSGKNKNKLIINQRLKIMAPPTPRTEDTDYTRENVRFPPTSLEATSRAKGHLYMFETFSDQNLNATSWKSCMMINRTWTCDTKDKPNDALRRTNENPTQWNEASFNGVSGFVRMAYFTTKLPMRRVQLYGVDGLGWPVSQSSVTGQMPKAWRKVTVNSILKFIQKWKQGCLCAHEHKKVRYEADVTVICADWNIQTFYKVNWAPASLTYCPSKEDVEKIPDSIFQNIV